MAIDDGYLISIKTPIADFLPEYEDVLSTDSLKKNITIEQLLTHRSGLSWDEIVSENDLNYLNLNQHKFLIPFQYPFSKILSFLAEP